MKILINLFCFVLLFGGAAYSQSVTDDLVGLGMKPELAEFVATRIPGGVNLDNNAFFKSTDVAGTGTISLIKADATDDTVINGDSGDLVKISIANTPVAAIGAATPVAAFTPAAVGNLVSGGSIQGTSFVSSGAFTGAGVMVGTPITGVTPSAGNVSIGGTLGVTGVTTLTGAQTLTGATTANGAVALNGGATLASDKAVNFTGFVPTMASTPVAGTNQLKLGLNVIPTAAADTSALLPTPSAAGVAVKLVNTGPNAVRIKAGGTNTINGSSAGAYIPLATLQNVDCVASSATNWTCLQGSVPTPAGP